MERLTELIQHRYPDATISYFNDVIRTCKCIDKLLQALGAMRNDKSKFIIIEKTRHSILTVC